MNPVGDDAATMACGYCNESFQRQSRARYCSTVCRQRAWRSQREAPIQPKVKKPDTVYECSECENRYLGEQRCSDCNVWCRKVGPGGACPNCDEPVSSNDLFTSAQQHR